MGRDTARQGRRGGGVALMALLAALAVPAAAPATTLTVDTTADEAATDADNFACSLREAVQAARTNAAVDSCGAGDAAPATDTIALAPGAVYTLTGVDGEDANASGDLDLGSGGPVVLDGGDGARPTINGGQHDRVLHHTDWSLKLDHIRVAGGRTVDAGLAGRGGAVYAGSALTVVDSVLEDNEALAAYGGAIGGVGSTSIAIADSALAGNTAGGGGGALLAQRSLAVTGSQFDGNSSDTGGGAISTSGGPATIADSTFTGNEVTGQTSGKGGAVELNTNLPETFSITESKLEDNTAGRLGGGLWVRLSNPAAQLTIDHTTIAGNDAAQMAADTASGGGLYVQEGAVELLSSVLSGNTASAVANSAWGGGLLVTGTTLTIRDSLIAGNSATSQAASAVAGAGIAMHGNGTLRLERSTIAGNSLANLAPAAQAGAGIDLATATGVLTAVNTTISGNDASTGSGGGVRVAVGAGGAAELIHSTVAANTAATGDAIDEAGTGAVTLRGSILTGADPASVCAGDGIISAGGNAGTGTTCALTAGADVQGDPPLALGALEAGGGLVAGAGGATQPVGTHGIASSSAAVDRVAVANCIDDAAAALTTDGRALPRPVGAGCDAGAVEFAPPPDPPSPPDGGGGPPPAPPLGSSPPISLPPARPLPPAARPPTVDAAAPSNAFRFGRSRRHRRRGVVVLRVRVPGAGRLTLTGRRVRRVVRRPGAARTVRLPIRAKGRARRRLSRRGRVRVRVQIRYTPRAGDARTRTRSVRLVQRRR